VSGIRRHGSNGFLLLLLVGGLALTGCETLGFGGDLRTSGFLGDYSQLQKGRKGEARLLYIDTRADFSGYSAIMIDPVAIWDPETSAPAVAPPAPLRDRADRFDSALRQQLQRDFELVDRPGPSALRLRVSLTDLEEPRLAVEVEVLDSDSGQRLVAAVDHQDSASKSDAPRETEREQDNMVDDWAEVIRARLVAFRDFDRAQALRDAEPGT